jgi:hypothetical protein
MLGKPARRESLLFNQRSNGWIMWSVQSLIAGRHVDAVHAPFASILG